MEHLLYSWPKIIERCQKAKGVLLLSDFDGTLATIVERPELAVMPEKTRRLLEALARQKNFKVGIISGRSLTDLKEKVNIDGLIYAGNHGFEIEGPGLKFVNPEVVELKPLFSTLRHLLSTTLKTVKGARVEDKGITLSIHYRQVDEKKIKDMRQLVERALSGPLALGMLKITSGKKVYEIRPAVEWDKGKAINLLMKTYGKVGSKNHVVPVYIGDDQTDEDGFRIIEKHGNGISIHIGEPEAMSAASYYLRSPEEVQGFLARMLEYAQKGLAGQEVKVSQTLKELPSFVSH